MFAAKIRLRDDANMYLCVANEKNVNLKRDLRFQDCNFAPEFYNLTPSVNTHTRNVPFT